MFVKRDLPLEEVNCDYCGSGEATFVAKRSDELHHTTD